MKKKSLWFLTLKYLKKLIKSVMENFSIYSKINENEGYLRLKAPSIDILNMFFYQTK